MTSGDLAKRLNVTDQTIRAWTKEFSEHLSEGAKREGETRYFNDDDAGALALIAEMRAHRAKPPIIAQALKDGQRGRLPAVEERADLAGTGTGLTVQQMVAAIGEQRGEIKVLREQIADLKHELDQERAKAPTLLADRQRVRDTEKALERLEAQLADERAARLDTLERATKAETRLEMLQGQQSQQAQPNTPARPEAPTEPQAAPSVEGQREAPRKSWLDWLRGR
jgi:DNA-binding transcriptional MerR regulator